MPDARVSPNAWRAVRLAQYFLGSRRVAVPLAALGLKRFEANRRNKARRIKTNGKATQTDLQPADLFLVALVATLDDQARAEHGAKSSVLRQEDYMLRFILHSLRLSFDHSSWLAVAVAKVLHNYSTEQTQKVYEEYLQGHANREATDDVYRGMKRDLFRALRDRFGRLLEVEKRGLEDRFVSKDLTDNEYQHVLTAMELLTVQQALHVVSLGPFSVSLFETAETTRAAQHAVDCNRMHAIGCPQCLGNLLAISGLPPTRETVEIPAFQSDSGPPPSNDPDFDRIREPEWLEECAEQVEVLVAAHRELAAAWKTGPIWLQCRQAQPTNLMPGQSEIIEVHDSGAAITIDVWGRVRDIPVLLGFVPINLVADKDVTLTLEFGNRSALTVAISRNEAASVTIRFEYVCSEARPFSPLPKSDFGPTLVVLERGVRPPARSPPESTSPFASDY